MTSTSFSIRNRIELSATLHDKSLHEEIQNFQYPQPDRIVCNTSYVPSPHPFGTTFSIRNRIELSATRCGSMTTAARRHLSVSATGSNCLQPIVLKMFLKVVLLSVSATGSNCLQLMCSIFAHPSSLTFQYPQPDRIVCNYRHRIYYIALRCTFSIRNRIELSATRDCIGTTARLYIFQYPQPDRIVCNLRRMAR